MHNAQKSHDCLKIRDLAARKLVAIWRPVITLFCHVVMLNPLNDSDAEFYNGLTPYFNGALAFMASSLMQQQFGSRIRSTCSIPSNGAHRGKSPSIWGISRDSIYVGEICDKLF